MVESTGIRVNPTLKRIHHQPSMSIYAFAHPRLLSTEPPAFGSFEHFLRWVPCATVATFFSQEPRLQMKLMLGQNLGWLTLLIWQAEGGALRTCTRTEVRA